MDNVIVTSNCQTVGLARAFQLLMPDSNVMSVGFQSLIDPAAKDDMVKLFQAADIVISINWDSMFGEFAADRIVELGQRTIFLPSMDFAGFHPDITYAQSQPHINLKSPLGDYNSLIAVAGYLCGLKAERVARLYNTFLFRKLGYFEAFDASRAYVVARFGEFGLEISGLIDQWLKRGSFMHSINHPKSFVLADLARLVCETHSLGRVHDVPYGELISDDLVSAPICPIFPEIARELGVPGSRHYKTGISPTNMKERLISIPEFVEESYVHYGQTDSGRWTISDRVKEAIQIFKTLD